MDERNVKRTQPTGVLILAIAAALGYVFDALILVMIADDSNRLDFTGILVSLPFAFALGYLQDYGLRVRQGRVAYFTGLAPSQLSVTNVALFFGVLVLAIIAIIVRTMDGQPNRGLLGYVVLMLISYLVTWYFQFARKRREA